MIYFCLAGADSDFLAELQNRHGFSCLFINPGVVEQIADPVGAMSDA